MIWEKKKVFENLYFSKKKKKTFKLYHYIQFIDSKSLFCINKLKCHKSKKQKLKMRLKQKWNSKQVCMQEV